MKINYVGELVAGKVIVDGRTIWFARGAPVEVSADEAQSLSGPDWSEVAPTVDAPDPAPAEVKKSRSRRATPADESTQTQEV